MSLLLTLIALYPCFQNDWVNWDDGVYVLQNGPIRDFTWTGITNMFDPTNRVLDTYTPLTLVSLSIDYVFNLENATAYHATNMLLHLINVLLVFLLIFRLINHNYVAFFIAVFFGLHPMHVESVAWISERKDLLFSFFFLASCLQYLICLRSSKKNRSIKYGSALFLGLLAILAKPQAVSLPLVLLLIQYWENKRFRILELIPFLILSLLAGLMAIYLMDENALEYSFFEQILMSGHACAIYLIKSIFPFYLEHNLGMPQAGNLPWYYYLSTAGSIVFIGLSFWFGRKNKKVIFGILFFCVTIIFSLHLLKINSGIAYDRFSYLPYIGLFMAFSGFFELIKNRTETDKRIIIGGATLIVLLFGYLANQRCYVWKNDETLWTNSLKQNPEDAMSWCKRARYYSSIGMYDKALVDQQKCIEFREAHKSDAIL